MVGKVARRGFLKLMGAAPVAGHMAAKAVVDAGVLDAAGIAGTSLAGSSPTSPPYASASGMSWADELKRAADYVTVFGIPEHVREEAWLEAARFTTLDVDIASKRSWSPAFKFLEQRRRNYEVALARIHHYARHQQKQSLFEKVTGWRWPL